MNRIVLGLLAAAAVALLVASPDLGVAVAFGWAWFVARVLPNVRWDGGKIAVGVAAFGSVAGVVYAFMRSLRRPWRPSTAVAATAGVVVLFGAGVAMIGATHQATWLAGADEPAFVSVERPIGWGGRSSPVTIRSLTANAVDLEHYRSHDRADVESWAFSAMKIMTVFRDDDGRYDPRQPWDAPANARFGRVVLPDLLNPDLRTAPSRDADGFGLAHYAANGRAMRDHMFRPIAEFTDGTATTLLIGEVNANFRPWADPTNARDPARGVNRSPHGFGGPPHRGGALFGMADGSVRLVRSHVSPAVLRALATPDGGESVDDAALVEP